MNDGRQHDLGEYLLCGQPGSNVYAKGGDHLICSQWDCR